jgi:cytochrome c oxidase subunit 2
MKRTFQLLAALGALAFLTFPAKSYADSDVSLAASMGKFAPNAIELHAGETTTLHLTSTEGVHWLKSDDLGIPMTTIRPGSIATVLVTPKKAGTYVLHCQMFCGPGHADMTITVTVV